MANNGSKKDPKNLSQIVCKLGRNQVMQHMTASFIGLTIRDKKDSFKGEKPTKEEFLDILWSEIESLILDLSNYVGFDESESESESETENELESIDIDSLM